MKIYSKIQASDKFMKSKFVICSILSEIFKNLHGLNPEFMTALFYPKPIQYSLEKKYFFLTLCTIFVLVAVLNLLYSGVVSWWNNTIPDNVKSKPSLNAFKNSLKAYNLMEQCLCIDFY